MIKYQAVRGGIFIKTFEYKFNYTGDEYQWILDNVLFNEYHQEKDIFNLLVLGYTCDQIATETGLSSRTIKRRRKSIHDKIQRTKTACETFDNKSSKLTPLRKQNNYQVYVLLFPNHKIYVGQSRNPIERWGNGNGYINNSKMYQDILLYGWSNVVKTIVYSDLTYQESIIKEKELISKYKSNLSEYGYNKTN